MSSPGGLSWQGGWDEPGVLSLVIIETGIPGSGLFLYNGVPGPGTLLASVTESATDPFGNTTQPGGFVIYDGSAYIDMHVNTTIGAPAIEFVTGVASENAHGAMYAVASNVGLVNESISMVIHGPASTFDGLFPVIDLDSSAADGSGSAVNGVLGISNTISAFWQVNGFFTTANSDTNVYRSGHKILTAAGQTISSTSPAVITGLSASVGIGTYKVAGSIRVVAAASGVVQAFRIQFNGTTTVLSAMRVRTRTYNEAAGVTFNAGTISGLAASGADTGGIPNGAVWSVDFEGVFTVSTAGTFHVDGLQSTSSASETFTVQALSWMELTPQ